MDKKLLFIFSFLFFSNGCGAGPAADKSLDELVAAAESSLEYDRTPYKEHTLLLPSGYGLTAGNYLSKVEGYIEKSVKGYSCTHCDHVDFSKLSHVKQHVGADHFKVRFGCPRPGCNRNFKRSDGVTRHINSLLHDGQMSHVCSICNKGFSRPDHLLSHMAIHSGKGTSPAKRRKVYVEEDDTEESDADSSCSSIPSISVNPFEPSITTILASRKVSNPRFKKHECLACSLHTGEYQVFECFEDLEKHRKKGDHDAAMGQLYTNKDMQDVHKKLNAEVPRRPLDKGKFMQIFLKAYEEKVFTKPAAKAAVVVPAAIEIPRDDDLALGTSKEAISAFCDFFNPEKYWESLYNQQ